MRKIHSLKIWPVYYDDVASGKKTFEVRKDDRNYQVGDVLLLSEWNGEGNTGRSGNFEIVYILRNSSLLLEGYCVLGIRLWGTGDV